MHFGGILFWGSLCAIGFMVGSFSSIVGGGALVLIPLFSALGTPLSVAIATMRLSSVLQQGVCVVSFSQRGLIEWRRALWAGFWCIPGALLGAHLVLHLSERMLAYGVASLMFILLLVTLSFNPKKLENHHQKNQPHPWRWALLALASLVLGVYGGFYGAGFSTLLMMVCVGVGSVSLISASADASVAALFMSIASSLLFFGAHLVAWPIFVPVTVGGMLGSWLGVRWAAQWEVGWIRALLATVVSLSILTFIFYS